MPRSLIIIDFINEFLHPDGKITPQGMGAFCEEYKTYNQPGSAILENMKKYSESLGK